MFPDGFVDGGAFGLASVAGVAFVAPGCGVHGLADVGATIDAVDDHVDDSFGVLDGVGVGFEGVLVDALGFLFCLYDGGCVEEASESLKSVLAVGGDD